MLRADELQSQTNFLVDGVEEGGGDIQTSGTLCFLPLHICWCEIRKRTFVHFAANDRSEPKEYKAASITDGSSAQEADFENIYRLPSVCLQTGGALQTVAAAHWLHATIG